VRELAGEEGGMKKRTILSNRIRIHVSIRDAIVVVFPSFLNSTDDEQTSSGGAGSRFGCRISLTSQRRRGARRIMIQHIWSGNAGSEEIQRECQLY
jgi:hypothetical protein